MANYVSSYIPTLGSSVTRLADAASKTGISSLIGQTEGTIYVEIEFISGAFAAGLIIRDAGFNAFAYINEQTAGRLFGQFQGVTSIQIQSGLLANGRYKCAFAYKSGDSVIYINGQLIGTSATTYTNPITMDVFDAAIATSITNAAALYTTRLSNSELASLTSL